MKDNPPLKKESAQGHNHLTTQSINAKFKRYFYIAYFCEGQDIL